MPKHGIDALCYSQADENGKPSGAVRIRVETSVYRDNLVFVCIDSEYGRGYAQLSQDDAEEFALAILIELKTQGRDVLNGNHPL